MKRRKSSHIITPKMPGLPMRTLLTRNAGMPLAWSTRVMIASTTGPPTTSAMKIVRRDQSISPSETWKTRTAADR